MSGQQQQQQQQQREQEQKQQKFFCDLADAVAAGKCTPEDACSMIGTLRDIKICPEDVLEPENPKQEKQKGFNEIAGLFADWQITTEEACELLKEWIDEWNI